MTPTLTQGTSPAIRCDNLRFHRGSTEVLHGLSFDVMPKGIVGLLGKNGAGKSTTIGLLMGYLTPTSGTCEILGEASHALTDNVRQRVGILHEGFTQYNFFTIGEIERYYAGFYPRWNPARYFDLVDRMGVGRDRKITALSCGQRSQVTLGLLFAQEADVLILDDFSLGLDVGYRRLFLSMLDDYVKARDATVLLTSHVVGELEDVLDQVILIKSGNLICNLPTADFKTHFKGYRLPVTEQTRQLTVGFAETVNVEQLPDRVLLYTALNPDEVAAALRARNIDATPERLTLNFEDVFVGLTGLY